MQHKLVGSGATGWDLKIWWRERIGGVNKKRKLTVSGLDTGTVHTIQTYTRIAQFNQGCVGVGWVWVNGVQQPAQSDLCNDAFFAGFNATMFGVIPTMEWADEYGEKIVGQIVVPGKEIVFDEIQTRRWGCGLKAFSNATCSLP